MCAQVLEEIPREYHCAIINELTAMAGRWVAVTMGAMVSRLPNIRVAYKEGCIRV